MIIKKIISSILAVAMVAAMSTTVFAEEGGEAHVTPESELTQEKLLEGEKIEGDTIYGKTIVEDVNSPRQERGYGPNYAESREILQYWYEGYIQFVPGYQTTTADGDGLVAGRFVRSAWIDYRRNNISVTDGGMQYTAEAPALSSSTYSASAKAHDTLTSSGQPGTTYFYRGWNYFS